MEGISRIDQLADQVDDLVIEVDGARFRSWESISLSRSIEQAAGVVRLAIAPIRPWPIIPGKELKVYLGDELMLDGYVDDLEDSFDATSPGLVQCVARDKTADLVDCSATGSEYSGLNLEQLATEIAKPYGIEIVRDFQNIGSTAAVFDRFVIQPAETAYAAIERACRLRAVLPYCTGDGRLTLTRAGAGTAVGQVLEGVNVGRAVVRVSDRNRFQRYQVRGQRQGSAGTFGSAAALVEGEASDLAIKRFRFLSLVAEGQVTFENAADRAQWEAIFRASRAATISVTIKDSWRQTDELDAPPWRVNDVVPVRIPSQQVDSLLLVRQVQFSRRKGSGSHTVLNLTRRDAYTPAPTVDTAEEALQELIGGEKVSGA